MWLDRKIVRGQPVPVTGPRSGALIGPLSRIELEALHVLLAAVATSERYPSALVNGAAAFRRELGLVGVKVAAALLRAREQDSAPGARSAETPKPSTGRPASGAEVHSR